MIDTVMLIKRSFRDEHVLGGSPLNKSIGRFLIGDTQTGNGRLLIVTTIQLTMTRTSNI